MASLNFRKTRKSLLIKGKFWDKEQLIKVAKSAAVRLGAKGKIVVVDIGVYNPDVGGQSVAVEYGCAYKTSGSEAKGKNIK